MATNRVYVPFTLFNVRIYNMKNLWDPSWEYKGKKQDKPNYMIGALVPKTRAQWWEEPSLAPATQAYMELLQKSGMNPQHMRLEDWPIRDGDVSDDPAKPTPDWMRAHWAIRGNSQQPISVSTVQNGNIVPLMNRAAVKPGDFAALALSAAINQQNGRAVKNYCNTVLFMAPGEEIAVGQGVTAAELMEQARKQGVQVVGFGGAPLGGLGGAVGQPGVFGGGAGTSFASPAAPAFGAPAGGQQPGFTPPPSGGLFPGVSGVTAAPQMGQVGSAFPSSFPAGPTFPGQ